MHASRYTLRLAVVLVACALAGCAADLATHTQAPASARGSPAGTPIPTPTFVPVARLPTPRFESISPPANAVVPPSEAGEPADAPPLDAPEALPPEPATVAAPLPQPTPVPVVAGVQSVHLDDDAWYGGWKQSKTYGGRSATWIYGTGTEYNAMEAAFELVGQPAGDALLSIEGMDGEHPPKMHISIFVNGVTLWTGPNPLPDDDMVLATGTWDRFSWTIPAAYLQPGVNTITIVALSDGGFGQPPFMMLDYADVYIGG